MNKSVLTIPIPKFISRLLPRKKFYQVTPAMAMRMGSTDALPFISGYHMWAWIYETHIWFRKGLNTKSNTLGGLTVQVYEGKDPVPSHPLTELFARVNPSSEPQEFWTSWLVDMDLAGEFFFEVVEDQNGQPVEVWRREPYWMDVVPSPNRAYPEVIGYKYLESNDLLPNRCAHLKRHNPTNPYRGLNLVDAIEHATYMDIAARKWVRNFMDTGARPDFAVTSKEGMTRTEREAYEQAIYDKFGGYTNSARFVILEEGVDIKPFSWKPSDVQWEGQIELSREEVGAILGVPDKLMGWGTDTYDNEEKTLAALTALWLLTLKPAIQERDRKLTHYFTYVRKDLKPGQVLKTDLTQVTELQVRLKNRIDAARTLFAMGVPFNRLEEVLELGTGPIPGGDTGYLSGNWIPIDMVGQAPPEAPAEEEPPTETSTASILAEFQELLSANGKTRTPVKEDSSVS